MYVRFNSRNAGNPTAAREKLIELIELIAFYANSEHSMFRDFADLLERYQDPIHLIYITVRMFPLIILQINTFFQVITCCSQCLLYRT